MKLVAAVASSALVLAALAPAAPAQAAVVHGAWLKRLHMFGSNGPKPCELLTNSTTDPSTTVELSARGGSTSLNTSRSGAVWDGSTVADLTSTAAASASFTTAGGGLSTLSLTASAAATFTRVAPSARCGSSGLAAEAAPSSQFDLMLPVTSSGWLDLSATVRSSVGAENRFRYQIFLVPAGGSIGNATLLAGHQFVAGTRSSRVWLPARASLGLVVEAKVEAELRYPDNGRRSASGTIAVSARFQPAGVATAPARGARLAKRAVVLPAAVSCAGRASIKLTKFARKKASSVVLAANGRVVKRLPRIKRARVVVVRVPTAGPITLRAVVKPKKGKKRVKVTRSYAACR